MDLFKNIIILSIILLLAIPGFSQRYGETDDFSYALKLYNEGFYDIAAQQFNLFANRYPNSDRVPDAKYYQAMSLFKLGEYENARIEFQSMAVSYPDHSRAPEAWQKVGECYLKLNKPQEAARALETVKSLYPENPVSPSALVKAARIYFRHRKYAQAETVLKDFLDRYPESSVYPNGRLLYANLLLKKQDFDQAFKEFDKVLKLDAEQNVLARAHLGLAKFFERLGQLDRAEEQYETLLNKYSNSIAAYRAVIEYSKLLTRRRDFEQAVTLINKNLSRFKQSGQEANLKLTLASVYYLQGNYFSARKNLESLNVKSLNDTLAAKTYFYLANVYLKENKFEESLTYFKKLLNDEKLVRAGDEFIEEARKQLGLGYLKTGQFGQGYETLQNFLQNNSDSIYRDRIIIRLFHYALQNERVDVAEDLYQQFLREYPRHPQRDDMLYALGKQDFRQNRFEESRSIFEKFTQEFNASSKLDSAELYLKMIRNVYIPDQQVGVKKLASLIGRMLGNEDLQKLRLELADIYLQQLKEIQQALGLCESIIETSDDPAVLGRAYYLQGVSYRRLAEVKEFSGQPAREENARAHTAFQNAMQYKNAVSFEDSLMFTFLRETTAENSVDKLPVTKKIEYWSHFIATYPNSGLKNRARMIIADLYLHNADTSRALGHLDSVIAAQDKKRSGEAYFQMGRIYYQQKNYTNAAQYLKEFLLNMKSHPRRAKAFALLATISEEQGNFGESAQFWARLREQYDYSEVAEQALNRIPQVFLMAGKYQSVVQFTQPYLQHVTANDIFLGSLRRVEEPVFYFYAGKANYYLDNYSAARTALLNYLYNTPAESYRDEALFFLAQIASKEGDSDAALLHLEAIAQNENSPFFVQASAKMADIYFEQEQYDKAQALYAKIIARSDNPGRLTQFKVNEMIALIRQGKLNLFENKRSSFKKTYRDQPQMDNHLANFELEIGKYYYQNKNFDRAIERFETVQSKYKKSDFADDAEYYLGLTYTTLNKVEKAQDLLTGFVRKHPDSELLSNVYITLGGLYYRSEERELAVGAFKKAVEKASQPDTRKIALSNLIKLYRDLGLWDGALNQARSFVEEFSDDETVMDKKILIGTSLIRLNRYSEAIDYLRDLKFEASSEQEPEIQFYIGQAYFESGQYENAVREFVKIPLLSKQTKLQWEASALYFSGQAYEKMGRIGDAIRMYQEIVNRPGILVDLKREARKRIEQLKNSG